MRSAGAGGGRHEQGRIHHPSLPLSPASFAALLILYASELARVRVNVWLCALRRKGCRRDCITAVAGAEGCYVRRLSGPAAVAVLSRWRLSVTICARMFYDTFVFNFGFYPLWWCIYYHWCLYFYQKDFTVMYSCIFTYECVFYYVPGQRWPNKQVKSINLKVNTLRPTQNGRHFPDDSFKCIFLNKNVLIFIKISLKFIPKGSINNIPVLV